MAAPGPRWHPPGDDSGGITAADLYTEAVAEYRFQAQFNWSRTQYLLVFNAAALAAGSAIAGRPMNDMAALVFGLGMVAALLSRVAVASAHTYYRAARDRMVRVEDECRVPAFARVDTTAVLGDRRAPVKVRTMVDLLFWALAAAHLAGAVLVLVF